MILSLSARPYFLILNLGCLNEQDVTDTTLHCRKSLFCSINQLLRFNLGTVLVRDYPLRRSGCLISLYRRGRIRLYAPCGTSSVGWPLPRQKTCQHARIKLAQRLTIKVLASETSILRESLLLNYLETKRANFRQRLDTRRRLGPRTVAHPIISISPWRATNSCF